MPHTHAPLSCLSYHESDLHFERGCQALSCLGVPKLLQHTLKALRVPLVCGKIFVSLYMARQALQEAQQRLCTFWGPARKPRAGKGADQALSSLQSH